MFRKLAVKSFSRRNLPRFILLLLPVVLSACVPIFGGSSKAEATITALQATINAQPTAVPTSAATLTPQPSATPLPPTAAPPTLPPTQPAAAPTAGPTQPAPGAANIEQKILSSRILLYEDIAGNADVFRYVAAALQRLGFQDGSYTDTGDAQGRFLTAMSNGAPGGQPWDLIIIANEDRDGIQGTFYEVLEGILNTGNTAVILETWFLDEIHQGTIKPILLRCGVDVVNWEGMNMNVFTLDANSPLLNEVVKVSSFNVLDYWGFTYDLGDLMYTTGSGDAKLVLGAEPGNTSQGGVLTECYDGRLILQTMSSHNYTDDTMVSLWANYIHYALRRLHGG